MRVVFVLLVSHNEASCSRCISASFCNTCSLFHVTTIALQLTQHSSNPTTSLLATLTAACHRVTLQLIGGPTHIVTEVGWFQQNHPHTFEQRELHISATQRQIRQYSHSNAMQVRSLLIPPFLYTF